MKKIMLFLAFLMVLGFVACEKDTVEDLDPFGKIKVETEGPGATFGTVPEGDPSDG